MHKWYRVTKQVLVSIRQEFVKIENSLHDGIDQYKHLAFPQPAQFCLSFFIDLFMDTVFPPEEFDHTEDVECWLEV